MSWSLAFPLVIVVASWVLMRVVSRKARRHLGKSMEQLAIARSVIETRRLDPDHKSEEMRWLRKEWPLFEQIARKNGVSAEKLEEIRRNAFDVESDASGGTEPSVWNEPGEWGSFDK